MAACLYLVLIIGTIACCLEMFDMVNGNMCYKINNKSNTERHHSINNKVYFCCDNSERLNAGCRECKIGFLSVHGEPCKPCSSHSFGRKCAQYCKCEMYESCHNVLGCITDNMVNTTKDSREKAMTITNSQTTKYPTGGDGDEDKVNNVFLYTVCTGSLALIMVLASSTVTYYRREKRKGNNSERGIQGGDNQGRSTIIIV